jgi:chemotaxis protein CheD
MGSPAIASLFAQRMVVGVGEMGVSNNASLTLSTYALGSCIAVVAYDRYSHTAGLLHLMLPNSGISPEKARTQPAMFADSGLPLLFRALAGLNANPSGVRLFVTGGANVLCSTDSFRIGARNIEATRAWLDRNGYTVHQSIVGGTINRTVHLDIGTGRVTLKTPVETLGFTLAP